MENNIDKLSKLYKHREILPQCSIDKAVITRLIDYCNINGINTDEAIEKALDRGLTALIHGDKPKITNKKEATAIEIEETPKKRKLVKKPLDISSKGRDVYGEN